ncbi:MAG: SIR2 family NAD-dependent protein deacylase [Carbonactinosporaceae bacterium]
MEHEVCQWLRASDSVTVLTGAGISTDSGIPDFRGPQGLWTRDPQAQRMFTLQAYLDDPQVRVRAWRSRRDHPAWAAIPNAGHRALVDLERCGRLRAIVTQNIDELHQRAGSSADLVIEVHGTVFWAECLTCEIRTPMPEVLARVVAGEADPACLACGGVQKSATISFGQPLRPDVFETAYRAVLGCGLLLVAGSSLQVQPAASLCQVAADNGARLVILNAEPTPYDDMADAVLREPIGEVLPRVVAAAAA